MKNFEIKFSPTLIIHGFALLHAVAAIVCILTGTQDAMFLTLLSMAMAVILCIRLDFNIEMTASAIIIVNLLGYFLGVVLAELFETFSRIDLVVRPLATLVTTEILGWGIYGIDRIFGLSSGRPHGNRTADIWWVLRIMVVVYALRIVARYLISAQFIDLQTSYEIGAGLLSNSLGLIVNICLNIIIVEFTDDSFHRRKISRFWRYLLVMLLVPALAAVYTLIARNTPFHGNMRLVDFGWWQTFTVALLVEITAFCIVLLIFSAVRTRKHLKREQEYAHSAQFRYQLLKQQVNPHFLFNSLNALDCLVQEGRVDEASTYIHKLSNMYRFILGKDSVDFVQLREELSLVRLYGDLMAVRFPGGFTLEMPSPETLPEAMVVPCAVQMLVENALKHNEAAPANPLSIKIEVGEASLTVVNNLNPKFGVESTKLGLDYIRQMYSDLTGMEIKVDKNDDFFKVEIPLI